MANTLSAAADSADRAHDIGAAANAIVEARRSAHPVAAVPLPDADASYAVQDEVARVLRWFDDEGPGTWKTGVAPAPLQRAHSRLPAAGIWRSPAVAGSWPFTLRGIEAEVALRIAQDVPATLAARLGDAQAAALVDAMCVSIEIVDSRWTEGTRAPLLDVVADLQSHGALVLGDWVPFAPRDWSTQLCLVRIGQRPPVERRGSHALGDPARLLADWMRHVTRNGHTLPAGTVVTTGSWVGILDAAAGDGVAAEFPGIGAARVQL